MSIKDKINSLIGNFEDETIVSDESPKKRNGSTNNKTNRSQKPAIKLADSGVLEEKKKAYESAVEAYRKKIRDVQLSADQRERKVESKMNSLHSEKKQIKAKLNEYRSELVNAEFIEEDEKISELSKKISKEKEKLEEISERIENYKVAKIVKVNPKLKEELLNLYKKAEKAEKDYRDALRNQKSNLDKIKLRVKKELEKIDSELKYGFKGSLLGMISRMNSLITGNRRIGEGNTTAERDRFYQLWLEGNDKYKNYLTDLPGEGNEISKKTFNAKTGQTRIE